METKRTPGPWHTGGHGNTIIYAADGWAVADVKVYHNRHNGYGETQANARLIAAAPDLLDALEAVKAWDVSNLALDIPLEIRKQMQAAIAKAEGR